MQSSSFCVVCNKSAHLKCAACHAVVYCSTQHQKIHWREHRIACKVYEMKTSPKLGHYLITRRKIRKGDPIYLEDALAIGPRHMDAIPGSCPGCYKALYSNLADKCPKCEWPACSRNCPGLTEPRLHGSECELLKIIKKVTNTSRMELLLPLRVLILQSTNPQLWETLGGRMLDASLKTVNYQLDPESLLLLSDLKLIARQASHIVPDCSETTLRNIYAMLNVCGRELYTPYSGPLAGVYPIFSLLVHSCVPNVTMTYEFPSEVGLTSYWRGEATIKATKTIAKGETLTFPFVNTFHPTLMRTKELKSLQYNRCTCARCLDPTELGAHSGTLKCLACPGYLLPVNPAQIENCDWVCDRNCGVKFTTATVEEFHNRLMLHIETLRWGGKALTPEDLEALVSSLEYFLHPRHYLCILVKYLLSKTYGEEEGPPIILLSTRELLRKSAVSKEVWTSMSDVNDLFHNATNIAECLMEQFRADFTLLIRYFNSGKWDSDRTVRAITDCRSLLSRTVKVCTSEQLYPPRTRIIIDVLMQEIEIATWAHCHGLELP